MTIKIYYEEHKLFDIEYCLMKNETEQSSNCWYTDISCDVCIEGITRLLQKKLKDESFDVEQFIVDSRYIQEIRAWLWEEPTHDNRMCDLQTATEKHYKVFKKELDEIIKTYCKKYNFSKIID